MKTIIVNDNKTLNNIRTFLSLALFLTPIIYLFIYFFYGVSNVFGNWANVITAIDLVFGFFKISYTAIYRPLFGCALGITYFVFFIIIVKNIIYSIKPFKNSLKKNESQEEYFNNIIILIDNFGKILFSLILYMVLSRIVSTYFFDIQSIIVIVSGIIVYLGSRVGIYVIVNKNLTAALYYNLLCNGIVAVALTIFMFCVCRVDMYEIFDGFNIFNIEGSENATALMFFFSNVLLKNIAYIVLQILTLKVIKEALSYIHHYSVDEYTVKKLMMASIVASAILIIISVYVAGYYSVDKILFASKPYVSILACSVAIFLSLSLPKLPTEEKENSDENVGSETALTASTISTEATTPTEPTEISEKPDEENSEISSK